MRTLAYSETKTYSKPEAYPEPWHIQNLIMFRTLANYIQNPGVLRTHSYSESEAYWEPWHIQKPDILKNSSIFRTRSIFRTLGYLEPEAYSEPCQTSVMELKLFSQILIIFAISVFQFFCEMNVIFLKQV